MTDDQRALVEAELILQRMAAAKPPELRVRVITPDDPDYGCPLEFDDHGQRIVHVTIRFDKPGESDLDDED